MEAHEINFTAVQSVTFDGTEASQSSIGTSTAVDYNLASIHKNSVILVDPLVHVEYFQFEPETFEACSSRRV
jgi:hypothetical protein